MGNCCGNISSKPNSPQLGSSSPIPIPIPIPIPTPQPQEDDRAHNINTPFLGTPDTMVDEECSSFNPLFVDPKLFSLLEFVRRLSFRRKDVFKRIIHVHGDKLEKIFDKMRIKQQEEKDNEGKSMRSIVRQRSMSFGDVDEIRLKRFKVKPIDSGGTTPSTGGGDASKGGGNGGGTKGVASK